MNAKFIAKLEPDDKSANKFMLKSVKAFVKYC